MSIVAEARLFKRYAKSIDFTLRVNERPFTAAIKDYSLQGLGVMIEGHPPIKKGDILRLGHIGIGKAGDATVAWSKPQSDSILVGLSLDSIMEGCFNHFQFLDVIEGMRKGKKTGTFCLTEGPRKKVYFKNGDLVFAASEEYQDRLDMLLLRKGKLSQEQLAQAVEKRWVTGKRLGAVLVDLGYLKPAELVEAVKMQAEEIVMSLFSLEYGCFIFDENSLPSDDLIVLKLPAANIIYRGLKEAKNENVLDQIRPSMDDVLRFKGPQRESLGVMLDVQDRKVLSIVDGKTSLKDICRLSPYGEKETMKSICILLCVRLIEPVVGMPPPVKAPEKPFSDLNREKAVLKFEEGMKKLMSGHTNEAKTYFSESIALDPSEPKYYYYCGLSLRNLNKAKEAEEAFSAALKMDPTNMDIIDQLNRLCRKKR